MKSQIIYICWVVRLEDRESECIETNQFLPYTHKPLPFAPASSHKHTTPPRPKHFSPTIAFYIKLPPQFNGHKRPQKKPHKNEFPNARNQPKPSIFDILSWKSSSNFINYLKTQPNQNFTQTLDEMPSQKLLRWKSVRYLEKGGALICPDREFLRLSVG